MELLIKLIIFTLPIQEYAISIGNNNHIACYELLGGVLVFVSFFKMDKLVYPRCITVMFFLIVWILLGGVFTEYPLAVLAKSLKIMLNIGVLIVIYTYLVKYKKWNDLVKIIYFTAICEAVFSLLEYVFVNYIGSNSIFHTWQTLGDINRLDGTFNDSNYLALYVSLCLMIVITDMIYNSVKKYKTIIAFLMITVLLLTFSRSGILAGIIGCVFICVRYLSYNNRLAEIYKFIFIGLGIAGTIVVCFLQLYPDMLIRYTTMFDLERGDVYVRIVQYLTAINMFLDNPIMGVGAGNYMNYIGQYNSYTGGTLIPHNSILEIAAETGIVAVILIVCFFYKIFSWSKHMNGYWLNTAALACLISTIISGMFYSNIYYQMSLYVYLSIGLSFGKCKGNRI